MRGVQLFSGQKILDTQMGEEQQHEGKECKALRDERFVSFEPHCVLLA
jgi:hypothetical protein